MRWVGCVSASHLWLQMSKHETTTSLTREPLLKDVAFETSNCSCKVHLQFMGAILRTSLI